MDKNVATQEVEWDALYSELVRLLSSSGRENPFGDGDFWIVDDNYGSFQHKVCVSRVSFLTPAIVASVQRLLHAKFSGWEVLLSLDGPGLRPTPEDTGVTVRAAGFEELWSRSRMAKAHGGQFRWPLVHAG